MTYRQLEAELIRDVLGIPDPHALTAAQFRRAAEAAHGTERGAELAEQLLRTMGDDEIADGVIWHRFGLEASRLTPEQRSRLLAVVDEECRIARTVPEGEWNEMRGWLEANRDRVHALADANGGLIEMPEGDPASPANILYAVRYTERDAPEARRVAADVRAIRNMVEGGEG